MLASESPTIDELLAFKETDLTAWDGTISDEFKEACIHHVKQCGHLNQAVIFALFIEGIEIGMVIMRNRLMASFMDHTRYEKPTQEVAKQQDDE
jgi:hypothetical protein